jgi:protein O-GlcNAc transferase
MMDLKVEPETHPSGRGGDRLPQMIFVCGPPHSGTSLVTSMLGAHPKVYAINIETKAFVGQSDAVQMLGEYVQPAIEKGAEFICEKTPGHVFRIRQMRKLFPGSKIIALVRDPRDTSASLKTRKGELQVGIKLWLNSVQAMLRDYLANADDLMILKYEELIEQPEPLLKRVCAHVGMGFDRTMLEFYKDDREWFGVKDRVETDGVGKNHNSLRNWQIHQPLMDRRGRWKQLLDNSEVRKIEARCGSLMRVLGYSMSSDSESD